MRRLACIFVLSLFGVVPAALGQFTITVDAPSSVQLGLGLKYLTTVTNNGASSVSGVVANGVSIGPPPSVVSVFFLTAIIAGTVPMPVENVVDTNVPDTAFRWDPTDQQWIFNITTSNLKAGSTYIYTISLNDGTTISFQFGLR